MDKRIHYRDLIRRWSKRGLADSKIQAKLQVSMWVTRSILLEDDYVPSKRNMERIIQKYIEETESFSN
jgi:hypothetical protein